MYISIYIQGYKINWKQWKIYLDIPVRQVIRVRFGSILEFIKFIGKPS